MGLHRVSHLSSCSGEIKNKIPLNICNIGLVLVHSQATISKKITSNIQYERCLLLTSGGDDYIVCKSDCIAVEVINAPSRVQPVVDIRL